ncbi:homeobox-leucine zipper protein HOX15-like [Prosopis cineraria]|uniref:homeobox-leucine zipper protein HOX15-like n=1 Tax=Prosopis cineraria TaxID=364024 RepID=UPI00240FA06B|nr:homeobox-leucine zipper protein HOX15-like [Prosopis cineraria]
MGLADMSNSGLGLGLGLGLHHQSENCPREIRQKKEDDQYKCDQKAVYPSLTLGPPDDQEANQQLLPTKTESVHFHAMASSPSAASSFSNSSSIKRENKEFAGDELDLEVENKVNPSKVGADVDEEGNPRKKLRLSKEQSAVLEDSFKEHSTLNPKQKQELARKLNLRARQVEVWFQNRRARTKLKQTEVDCELLKKCCETLTEENKRLQKELQELRSIKTTSQGPLYMQLPAATLTLCPSCERICGGGGGATTNGSPAATVFLTGSKAHHLYKSNYPFAHSPAAC